ncbi:MAG: hypothetical protein AB7F75_04940 [Planctomycetota bacterium]
MEKKQVQVREIADLSRYCLNSEIVSFNVGHAHDIHVVFALKPTDYREVLNGVSFTKIIPSKSQDYTIVSIDSNNNISLLDLPQWHMNFHLIQTLPNRRFLLACSRCRYRGLDDWDLNGEIIDSNGKKLNAILIGDGIQDIQTTSKGIVWTSYFDEGIFGNFGWESPIGSSGLVAWTQTGEKLYDYIPGTLDYISDCYSMNVESDDVTWIHYYTEFPLVKIRDFKIEAHWDIPNGGSKAFAIYKDFALMSGAYGEQSYSLLEIAKDKTSKEDF